MWETRDAVWVIFFVLFCLICYGLGVFRAITVTNDDWEKECIRRGVAVYSAKEGEFQWKPEFQIEVSNE